MKSSWTTEEVNTLISEYANTRTAELAKRLGKSVSCVYYKAYALKLLKSEEFNNSIESGRMLKGVNRGIEYRFKKGSIPVNKGRKQEEFMSKEQIEKTKATRFKKGNAPHNTKFDGCISIRTDKCGRKYFWIRTGLAKWPNT